MERPFAFLDDADEVNEVLDFDFGVGANACFLEGGTGDDARLVADVEDRRAAGLFDLDDFAFEVNGVADLFGEFARLGDFGLVSDGDGFVVVGIGRRETQVAVVPDFDEFDDEFVADVVRRRGFDS